MSRDPMEPTLGEKLLAGIFLTGIAIGLIALATAITIEEWWKKYVGRHFQRNKVCKVRESNRGSLRNRCVQKMQSRSKTRGEKRIRE